MPDQIQQPSMLDPDTAYSTVHHRIYTPVFFQKVANDYGFKPATEQEAMQMLTIAAQLRESYDKQNEKTASQDGLLTSAMEHLGIATGTPGQTSPEVREKAAAERALDPDIAHAVLSLHAGVAGITPAKLAQQAAAA